MSPSSLPHFNVTKVQLFHCGSRIANLLFCENSLRAPPPSAVRYALQRYSCFPSHRTPLFTSIFIYINIGTTITIPHPAVLTVALQRVAKISTISRINIWRFENKCLSLQPFGDLWNGADYGLYCEIKLLKN